MVTIWHIYHVNKCQYTSPQKEKYIAIVCAAPNPHGFLINSRISRFISGKPEFLNCQVKIDRIRYSFLDHDSFIDCSRLRSFKQDGLHSVQGINNNTKKAIQRIVNKSRLIEPIYKKLICK